MVSVNYNMKINTKKQSLEQAKDQNQIMKIVVAEEIIEQVKEFYYLGSMISDEIKRRIATAASIWLKSGGRGSGSKKFRFLQANFRKISIFSGNITKEYRVLQANFLKF